MKLLVAVNLVVIVKVEQDTTGFFALTVTVTIRLWLSFRSYVSSIRRSWTVLRIFILAWPCCQELVSDFKIRSTLPDKGQISDFQKIKFDTLFAHAVTVKKREEKGNPVFTRVVPSRETPVSSVSELHRTRINRHLFAASWADDKVDIVSIHF